MLEQNEDNNQQEKDNTNISSFSKPAMDSNILAFRSSLTDVSSRLKILEERYNTLRKTIGLTEKNAIDVEKKNFSEFQILSENLLSIKKTIHEFSEQLTSLESEINNFVPRKDFKILERYLNFWQPMDFVTRDEVNAFLRKKFKELEPDKKN